MTDATKQAPVSTAGDDAVLPFQLDALAVRGRVARLDGVLEQILAPRAYPTAVAGLIAEMALLTALIGDAIKLRGRFSIQARGDGPVRMISTDFLPPEEEGAAPRIRAWASYDAAADLSAGSPFALLGAGVLGVIIDQGPDMRPYQGVTPLVGDSLAATLEGYFAQSEQIATRFALAAAQAQSPGGGLRWRAGGMMIQHLPEPSAGVEAPKDASPDGLMTSDAVAEMTDRPDDWRAAALKLATVDAHELLGPHVTPEQLLVRLFHEDGPRVFAPHAIRFGCTCSAERVEQALGGYDEAALAQMRGPEGAIVADCQFCGAEYVFDAVAGVATRRDVKG